MPKKPESTKSAGKNGPKRTSHHAVDAPGSINSVPIGPKGQKRLVALMEQSGLSATDVVDLALAAYEKLVSSGATREERADQAGPRRNETKGKAPGRTRDSKRPDVATSEPDVDDVADESFDRDLEETITENAELYRRLAQ